MSAVTVSDLVGDYEDEYIIGGSGAFKPERLYDSELEELDKITIIPRAVAERAIKEFVIQEDRASDASNTERAEAFQYAYTFINQLLKEFEGEEVQ